MFRHGARSPIAVDKDNNTPYGNNWSNHGELTPAGHRMHFLLGLRNRQIYKGFQTKTKVDGSVYVRSSDYNRTIESVQSQLQGLFPAGTAELIGNERTRELAHPFIDDPRGANWENENKFLNMRSIVQRVDTFPVHLFSATDPYFSFFYNPFICKKLAPLIAENNQKDEIKSFLAKLKEQHGQGLMKLLKKENTDFLDNYMYVFGLMDTFISDEYDGRDLSKLTEAGIDIQAFNATAWEFSEVDILTHYNGDNDGFFARWTTSMLWPEVIKWMENRIAADKAGNGNVYHGYNLPRMGIFSTHDVTVGSGLTVLNRAFGFKKYYTPFACDIFFELHTPEGKQLTDLTASDYTVQVKYQSLLLGTVAFPEFKEKLQAQFYSREELKEQCGFAQ